MTRAFAPPQRFVDELGRRDFVSGEMTKRSGPFRLLLNEAAAREIEWRVYVASWMACTRLTAVAAHCRHCKHYIGRGE